MIAAWLARSHVQGGRRCQLLRKCETSIVRGMPYRKIVIYQWHLVFPTGKIVVWPDLARSYSGVESMLHMQTRQPSLLIDIAAKH